jgi:hypothetical protein
MHVELIPVAGGGGGGGDRAPEWRIPKPGTGLRGPRSRRTPRAPEVTGGGRTRAPRLEGSEVGRVARSEGHRLGEGWHGRRGRRGRRSKGAPGPVAQRVQNEVFLIP